MCCQSNLSNPGEFDKRRFEVVPSIERAFVREEVGADLAFVQEHFDEDGVLCAFPEEDELDVAGHRDDGVVMEHRLDVPVSFGAPVASTAPEAREPRRPQRVRIAEEYVSVSPSMVTRDAPLIRKSEGNVEAFERLGNEQI